MTLLLHYPSSCFANKLLHHTTPKSTKFTIISQNSPQSQEPTTKNDPIPKPTPSSGLGFGSGSAQQSKPNSTPSPSSSSSSGKMKKGRRDVIRRNPVEKPAFLGKKNGGEGRKESVLNESAFLLTWLGLGGLIFVEGIALSISGFLPDKWDKLFVKYIYPSFTPTVFLFVAASVVYGVIKLQYCVLPRLYSVVHFQLTNQREVLSRVLENQSEWNYNEEDIAHKFYFFNVLKDGRIHLLFSPKPGSKIIPAVDDPLTGVKIKDVVLSDDVSVRMFLPGDASSSNKLPVLFYVHGGGFCFCSAFSVDYTGYLTRLVAECNVIAISVEYGLFPARPMPACYEECWFALQWLAAHADADTGMFRSPNSPLRIMVDCLLFYAKPLISLLSAHVGPRDPWITGRDPWITDYADLTRIFAGGDSAGGNICHDLLSRVGKVGLPKGSKVEGMILIHPYFGLDDKMWMYMCPTNEGPRDPRMRPAEDDLAVLGCKRVLVLVAEKDMLKDAGVNYAKELKNSGWIGNVELYESKDRKHCFLISKHSDPEAIAANQLIKSFINRVYVG